MNENEAFRRLFGKRALTFSAKQIRETLEPIKDGTGWAVRYVVEALRDVSEAELPGRWAQALTILQAMKTKSAVAPTSPPWVLRAFQTATVATWCPVPVLVALAKDGSDASRDALIADFGNSQAEDGPGMLEDRLKDLRKYGSKDPLLRELAKRHEAALGPRKKRR